jgi:hypothetical protein
VTLHGNRQYTIIEDTISEESPPTEKAGFVRAHR